MKNSQSLSEDVVLKRIDEKCKEADFTFFGFNNPENKYINNSTKLILKCNKCSYEWNTTIYYKFVSRNNKCLKCTKKLELTDEEKIKRIEEKCKEVDFSFLGFEENGNLKLRCNKCGYEWNTTSFYNFLKKDRKSHTCGRNAVKFMPSHFKDREKIKQEVIEKLKNTNLEFVDFVEKENIPCYNYHYYLKCKKCGIISKYTHQRIFENKKTLKCPICENFNKRDNDDAIKQINEVCKELNYTFLGFKNEYNRYLNKKTKLILQCNKCGYIWDTTNFYEFITKKPLCRNCKNCWKMEKEVRNLLSSMKIDASEQKTFNWLTYKGKLKLDFYLPKYNIAIECQGRQHFMPIEKYGGYEGFENCKIRDTIKYNKCKEENVELIYFNNQDIFTEFMGQKIIRKIKDLKNYINGKEKN